MEAPIATETNPAATGETMDKRKQIQHGVPFVDLSTVTAHVEVGHGYPKPGNYFSFSVEDVGTSHTGNRHIMICGNIREVGDILLFMGYEHHAGQLYEQHGISPATFAHPERLS